MSQTKVLVAQLGARKHYQEPILFQHWGILDKLYTDFYLGHIWLAQLLRHIKIYKHLPNIVKKGLERYDSALDKARVIHLPWLGYQYTQALRKAAPEEISRIYIQIGKEFCQRIIQNGLGNANTIYGFNGASLELFEYAKAHGIRCILDQTLAERGLVHQLLLQEEQSCSEWSLSPFTVSDADLELVQREQCEQDLADRIICGSDFVKDSLIARGVSASKISVVALGRCKDPQMLQHKPNYKTPQKRGDGLKILFAGTVGLRKGIPYLLEALQQLQGKIPLECKIAGSLEIKPQRIAEYSNVCDFVGIIPRSQMAALYAWADVLVLPSICEGSAMVTYEALSWGLPVITTINSGSLVRDGIDGFIVPVRDAGAIASKLLHIYQGDYQIVTTDSQNYLKQMFSKSEYLLRQAIL